MATGAGCGSAEREPQTVTSSSEPPQVYVTPEREHSPKEKGTPKSTDSEFRVPHTFRLSSQMTGRMDKDPIYKSVRRFQKRIITERKAEIVAGACAVWAYTDTKMIVTINPGTATAFINSKTAATFPIFNEYRRNTRMLLIPRNGPETITRSNGQVENKESRTMISSIYPSGMFRPEIRLFSDQPIKDTNGHVYFVDKTTGEPLMVTEKREEPFTKENAVHACIDLYSSLEYFNSPDAQQKELSPM
jgi:hypothetical protein